MPTKKPKIKTHEAPAPVSLTGLSVTGTTAETPKPSGKPTHLPNGACDSFPSHKPGGCMDTAPKPPGK